jgi:hypothetical protein
VRPWFLRRLEDVNPPEAKARRILTPCSPTASSAPRPRGSSSSSANGEAAEAMIREARGYEPMVAEGLRVEAIELD